MIRGWLELAAVGFDITRNRNDLNAVEIAVGRVIADDDCCTGLLDLTAERRIEIDPPNFTAKHGVL